MVTTVAPALRLVESLVLARLLVARKKSSRSEVKRGLEPIFAQRLTEEEWEQAFEQALGRLLQAGRITRKPLCLTESGRRRALEFLGVEALPPRLNWRGVKATLLMEKALKLPPLSAEDRKRLGQVEHLRAALIRKCCDLPIPDVPDLNEALNTLYERRLGIEPRNNTPDELRLAVLRRWVEQAPDGDRPAPEPRLAPEPSFNLAGFADVVKETARSCAAGNQVPIAQVWRQLQQQDAEPEMSEAEFRNRLIEAHRAGLLSVSGVELEPGTDHEEMSVQI